MLNPELEKLVHAHEHEARLHVVQAAAQLLSRPSVTIDLAIGLHAGGWRGRHSDNAGVSQPLRGCGQLYPLLTLGSRQLRVAVACSKAA